MTVEAVADMTKDALFLIIKVSLPILLISGQDDPVGDGGKGVQEISRRMKKSGMENVTIKLFPGARHDLLHEEKNGADAARKYIAEWIKQSSTDLMR